MMTVGFQNISINCYKYLRPLNHNDAIKISFLLDRSHITTTHQEQFKIIIHVPK